MKALKVMYLCVSFFALSTMITLDLYADGSNNRNSRSYTADASDQKAPIPQSMLPRREPLQSDTGDQDTSEMTISEVITDDSSFKTLAEALDDADLINRLSDSGPYTIFAPNDAAFAKLSPNALADMLKPENKAKLVSVLTYHIVPGKITADQLKSGKIKTVHGKPLNVQVKGNEILVNNAKVVQADVPAANGEIYTIDTVLSP
jgi:uncharacterized surface protein with fasciclin (FAS1) repeats